MMRALTLHQPWAWAVAAGYKPVENRTWTPPLNVIGERIAIHAGRTYDDVGQMRVIELVGLEAFSADPETSVAGAVVAVVRLERVVCERASGPEWRLSHLTADERRWFVGPFGWVLRDVVRLARPVPCRGYQQLWTLPADVEASVLVQVEASR